MKTLKVDITRLEQIKAGDRERVGIAVSALLFDHESECDIAALTEVSLRDWVRDTVKSSRLSADFIVSRILGHHSVSLSLSDLTAENALAARAYAGELSGSHTLEKPWGGQCTAILPNGVAVDRERFVHETLRVLAGVSDGTDYRNMHHKHIRELRAKLIKNPKAKDVPTDSEEEEKLIADAAEAEERIPYHELEEHARNLSAGGRLGFIPPGGFSPAGDEALVPPGQVNSVVNTLMEDRRRRQEGDSRRHDTVENSHPGIAPVSWWVVKVRDGEERHSPSIYENFVIEALDGLAAGEVAERLIDTDQWRIHEITAFEKWCK